MEQKRWKKHRRCFNGCLGTISGARRKCSERIFNRRISIDGRVYKEQIDQLSQIYYSYSELFRGLSENPQEDYEKMMQEMEAAGINAITEEVNNQLDQWYNTVR